MTDARPERYDFEGVPLTPAVAAFLVRELFTGRLAARQAIEEEVVRTHAARGGLKAMAQNVSTIFKKTLYDLQTGGFAENAAHGYWRILGDSPATELEPSVAAPVAAPNADPHAEVALGSGAGAVYVYYLPAYRTLAESRGEKRWPCKIGRTECDPVSRVLSQAATALPERPRIGVIVRSEEPSAWENALHGVLTLRGFQLDSSPGQEWFLTSPDEVLELVRVLDPSVSGDADA